MNRRFVKKKIKEIKVGSKIHFIDEPSTGYKFFEGKVLEFLKNDMVKVLVRSRFIHDSNDFLERIIPKKKLTLDK